MLPALSALVVLCAAIGAATSADPTFDPGCSFFGGQCVYSIKLGHSGQCDKTQSDASMQSSTPSSSSSIPSDGGCCSDLSTKYSQLTDQVDKLKIQMNVMTQLIGDSSKNMSDLETELQKALIARDDIVMVLNRKESELNTTKVELAKVMADAAKEIQYLRDNLNNVHTSYSTCQSALSGMGGATPASSSTTGTGAQTGDYSMTYYDFNGHIQDFTFPQSSYGHFQIAQLHSGSSTTTGPRVEHSWGVKKGSYLGIDSHVIADKVSYPHTTRVEAESTTFPPASAYCIMFWYYMEGADVQTLTTNVKINGGVGYPIFSRTGPVSSHKWQLAKIDLDSEYTQYQFQIDFTMTSDAYYSYSSGRHVLHKQDGDIAIDDLYIVNTTCSTIPRHPAGQQQLQQSFYGQNVTSFYTFHLTPMTWTEAYETCRRQGPWTALVSIETGAEHAALVKMIRANPAYSIVGAKGFYTSGTDADAEHKFVWTNNGEQREIKLDNWHTGQPNNVAGNQDCLLMEYANDDYKWGDVDCDTKHPFICEVELPGKVTN